MLDRKSMPAGNSDDNVSHCISNHLTTYDEAHGHSRRIFNNLRNPYDEAHGSYDEAHTKATEEILQLVDIPRDKDLTTAGFASILVFFWFWF